MHFSRPGTPQSVAGASSTHGSKPFINGSRPGTSAGSTTPLLRLTQQQSTASSYHSSSAAPSIAPSTHPTPSPHHSGLLGQFQHLLPKHAIFHACIQVHQISSVPLVHGDFAVRWKIKNLTDATHSTGSDSKASFFRLKRRDREGRKKKGSKGSINVMEASDVEESEYQGQRRRSTSSSRTSLSASIPNGALLMQNSVSSLASSSNSAHSALGSFECPCGHPAELASTRGLTPYLPLKDHSVIWSHTMHAYVKIPIQKSTPTSSKPKDKDNASHEGTPTPKAGEPTLAPSVLKFVVMQRIASGDPGAPRNPRFGALYLNLSEYAGVKGETTRRYLLQESKMNATLKITISMTQVGGETNFHAPPLPKGEILTGVTGYLESDILKTRPRALDLFGSYYNLNRDRKDLDIALAATKELNSRPRYLDNGISDTDTSGDEDMSSNRSHHGSMLPPLSRPAPTPQQRKQNGRERNYPSHLVLQSKLLSPILASPRSINSSSGGGDASAITSKSAQPFDVSLLPYAYGQKTTETLIEAIFNPVPVTPDSLGSLSLASARRGSFGKAELGLDEKDGPMQSNPFVYVVSEEEAANYPAQRFNNGSIYPPEDDMDVDGDLDRTIGRRIGTASASIGYVMSQGAEKENTRVAKFTTSFDRMGETASVHTSSSGSTSLSGSGSGSPSFSSNIGSSIGSIAVGKEITASPKSLTFEDMVSKHSHGSETGVQRKTTMNSTTSSRRPPTRNNSRKSTANSIGSVGSASISLVREPQSVVGIVL